jgi:dTDP-4-dehydrorhamnose 3,5-epimerase-like enzyme
VDVELIPFDVNTDQRGILTAIETPKHIPFLIRRIFFVYGVAPGTPRGGHAHRDTQQVIVACHGALTVRVSDGLAERTFHLCTPDAGLFVGQMLWVDLLEFSPETVCLVMASTEYDQRRSIRTWAEYSQVRGTNLPETLT